MNRHAGPDLVDTLTVEKMAAIDLEEVRVSNLPARSLYQKLGFYEAGVCKNYYRSPTENALLLQYDFDERCWV